MSHRGQRTDLDQNHNKRSIIITTNNKRVSNNNNNMGPNQKLSAAAPAIAAPPSMPPTNNGFRRDIMSFDQIPPLSLSMSTEDMANLPIPLGVQEFLMPMETFFFSGFQCFESIAGGSTVAIDNKIEQAMDLVKRHLMYAVREEVEILKQQIGEMMDRIGQLEYENTVLRSEAKPETLNKLLQPRLAQPQTALPTQPQTASITAAPTQQQPAVSQIQPPQQQQQQTTVSQVGQPPSTT